MHPSPSSYPNPGRFSNYPIDIYDHSEALPLNCPISLQIRFPLREQQGMGIPNLSNIYNKINKFKDKQPDSTMSRNLYINGISK